MDLKITQRAMFLLVLSLLIGVLGGCDEGGDPEDPCAIELNCTEANSLCAILKLPPDFSATPAKLYVVGFDEWPPSGMPSTFLYSGTDVPLDFGVCGKLPLKLENLAVTGELHVVYELLVQGGGSVIPTPGVDYVSVPDGALNFDGKPINLGEVSLERYHVEPEVLRHYAYRSIAGFSMGAITAATIGLRYSSEFDILLPMGGALDMGFYMHVLRDEVFSGFCSPPVLGQMCPDASMAQHYEDMDCGGPNGGGFDRENMIEAFMDAAIAMGNFMAFNPENSYLPPGIDPARLFMTSAEWCANPVRLEGYHDWRYNPEGLYPVITYCEGDGPAEGVFDQDAAPDFPVEITLAVDLNDNGRRDSGEPVLFWGSERFEDTGEDGVPSEEEAGYDPVNNPDPAGDDWHALKNALGSEGNHFYEEGEPFIDNGLDGVEGTADSPYDFGEGNGQFDFNPNIASMAAMHDPARLLKNISDQQLARLDFYIDAGIRDHLRFRPASESFAGILAARGRPVDIRDGFASILEPDYEGAFDIAHIDWANLGRDVMVRYGNPDATPDDIAGGDGGHVGNGAQVFWRFFTCVAYISSRWPKGDFEPTSEVGQVLADQTYHSEILDMDKKFIIYLPPGYDSHPDSRYPVVYMLHGIGMSAESLVITTGFAGMWMQEGKMQKFIMVFPDGECQDDCFSGNFFANQAGRHLPPRRYEDSLIQELLPFIDANFRTKLPEDVPFP